MKSSDFTPIVVVFGRNIADPNIVKQFNIKGFEPYFYAPANAIGHPRGLKGVSGEVIKDALGRDVRKITTGLPNEVPRFRNAYEWTDEADVLFDIRFMIDHHIKYAFRDNGDGTISAVDDIEPLMPRIMFFDIEVRSPPDIIPDPKNPTFPIVSIQIGDSYTKEITVFTYGVPQIANDQRAYDDEGEMLVAVMDYIQRQNFDVLTGWYSNGFDIPYIVNRLHVLNITDKKLTRFPHSYYRCRAEPRGREWMIKIPGRQCLDMMDAFKKWYKAEGELEKYDLKSVAAKFVNFEYADYGAHIDELFNTHQWEEFLQYCRNDVIALMKIDDKLKLFDFYEHLRMKTGVKLEDTMKNSKMIESLLFHFPNMRPMPTRRYDIKAESYSGALVITPEVGLHHNVGVFDLAALYPTIIRAFEVSPDIDKVIPIVIVDLMEEREKLRELKRKGLADESTKKKEVVVKFLVNSFYGVLGWPMFRLYKPEMALFITSTGQDINRFLQKCAIESGHPAVYGDSVAPTSPVLVKRNDLINIIPIDHISEGDIIWNGKWTRVVRVIKKPLTKDIYYVSTRAGNVVCTEDHSLLVDGEEVSPTELFVGDGLDIIDWPLVESTPNLPINEDIAWIIGIYLAEGSRFNDHQYVINGKDDVLMELCQQKILSATGKHVKISDYLKSSNCKRISYLPIELRPYLEQCYTTNTWFEGAATPLQTTGYKIIPTCILNASPSIIAAFLDGYYAGDGDHNYSSRGYTHPTNITSKNVNLAVGLCYLYDRLGTATSVHTHKKSLSWNIYIKSNKPSSLTKPLNTVTNVIKIPKEKLWFNHVVDLEVEDNSHVFASGRILLHNTDSVFLKGIANDEAGFEMQSYLNTRLVEWANEHNAKVAPTIKFEKLYRKILFKQDASGKGAAKKRYAGHLISKDGEPCSKLSYTGIELKRSDQAEFTRTVLEEFLTLLLLHDDEESALSVVKKAVKVVENGEVDCYTISIPKGVRNLNGNDPWSRGARRSDELLGLKFPPGVKPRLIYTKGEHTEICIDDTVTEDALVSCNVRIDYKTMQQKVVEGKLRSFIESIGRDWDKIVNGQTSLFDFVDESAPVDIKQLCNILFEEETEVTW